MKRCIKTKRLISLLVFLLWMAMGVGTLAWGYDTAGMELNLYADPGHPEPKYVLGSEPVPLILVERNVAYADLVTRRGFSQEELHQTLIVTDPSGRRHFLNAGAPAHRMPMPFFIADRAWAKAESLARGWERSALIEDLRDHVPVMNSVAGWYTIQAQQPFVRYAALRRDTSLGHLGEIDNAENWEGTLKSNVLQVFVTPAAGAQIRALVTKLEDNMETPLPQVAVRVFDRDAVPPDTQLETVWSAVVPTLTGTTDFEGAVHWTADSVCLPRDDYLVVARYGGEYEGEAIEASDEPGWTAECQGLIAKAIVFETASPVTPGDLDGDGDVDYNDYLSFRAAYGACNGDSNFNPAADLDNDDCVTINDYRILRSLM
jgi:hypothetical protein